MAVISAWIRRWIFLPLHAGGFSRWPLAAALLVWALLPAFRNNPRKCAGRMAALLIAAALLTLCWLALYDAPAGPEIPDERALLALADELGAALNEGSFAPVPLDEMIETAQQLTPDASARFRTGDRPWLLVRLEAAGVFLPFINEVWLDTAEPEILQPFTAVHERFHACGYADEGVANRMAYEACVQAGGSFAQSARIYAAKLLWQSGTFGVRRRLYQALSEENRALLQQAGAFRSADFALPAWVRACLPGTVSYDGLIAWLAEGFGD